MSVVLDRDLYPVATGPDRMGRKIYLPVQIKKADTFVGRFLGLMFRRSLPGHSALWLIPCNSIHMFFMRFSIDVVFLDKQNKIVKLAEHVQPWSMIPPVGAAYSALELQAGTIRKHGLQVGDQIII